MDPAAQKDLAETSLDSKPMFGPHILTEALRVLNIIVGMVFTHRAVVVMTKARGEEGGAALGFRYRTCQSRSSFGHISGYPENLWPIILPLYPFF